MPTPLSALISKAAAINVLRYSGDQFSDKADMLKKAAADSHGRVRLEAIIAASWMEPGAGMPILKIAADHLTDNLLKQIHGVAVAQLKGDDITGDKEEKLVLITVKDAVVDKEFPDVPFDKDAVWKFLLCA